MSEQLKAAFGRALIVGAFSAISTGVATWATTDDEKAIIAAVVSAFAAPFVARFGGEGTYDTKRDQTGNVKPGDVGAPD